MSGTRLEYMLSVSVTQDLPNSHERVDFMADVLDSETFHVQFGKQHVCCMEVDHCSHVLEHYVPSQQCVYGKAGIKRWYFPQDIYKYLQVYDRFFY
jgi:hypothetical protein